MAFEYSDYECAEEHGSSSEDYDEVTGYMSASVTLRCAYADRHLVAADICGNRRPWPKGGFGLTPRAAKAGIRPAENAGVNIGQMCNPLHALVTVYYSSRNEDVVTESLEPTNEFVQLDHRMFRWNSGTGDHLAEEEAPGRLVRLINFVRTEMYVTGLNPSIMSLMGSVNNDAVSSSLLFGLSFAAETLLLAPPTVNRKISAFGVQQYDQILKWSYNPAGWNTYYRAKTGNYEKIYVAGASDPYNSYPLQDHSVLFS